MLLWNDKKDTMYVRIAAIYRDPADRTYSFGVNIFNKNGAIENYGLLNKPSSVEVKIEGYKLDAFCKDGKQIILLGKDDFKTLSYGNDPSVFAFNI